jgi:hypothetical protein
LVSSDFQSPFVKVGDFKSPFLGSRHRRAKDNAPRFQNPQLSRNDAVIGQRTLPVVAATRASQLLRRTSLDFRLHRYGSG